MLKKFFSENNEKNVFIDNGDKTFTFSEIKAQIAYETEKLKNKKKNVAILSGDNYGFIIQFFASVFSRKNIYLITEKSRLKDLDDFDLLEDKDFEKIENYEFPDIDYNNPCINFYTSGSSGNPKIIKKSLYNLIVEAEDICQEFQLQNKNLTVMSTTTMCHLFGLTFHLMFPLYSGLKICTKEIFYPENVDSENILLVSTPSFLSTIPKYNLPFTVSPQYIFSAGAKLEDGLFEYLEKSSNIVEIYGSTETGIIAHREHFSDKLKLFDNVCISAKGDFVEINSEYIYEKSIIINDKIELNGQYLTVKKRTDRLFKICEKRISADELENRLKENEMVENCYITEHLGKLVCLCSLSKIGKDYLLKNNISLLIKSLKQHLLKYSEIVPQRWKFIDLIPMTTTGKIDKNSIKNIFDKKLSLPIILDRTVTENSIDCKIYFYNQCNFFEGHFPKFKILAGVVQLYLVKELANSHFCLDLGICQMKRIKFSNIIKAGSIINLKLEKSGNNIIYEYYSGDKKYASGVFLCENIFSGV